MEHSLILQSINSDFLFGDFSFLVEIGLLLCCFIYFWFNLISYSFFSLNVSGTRLNKVQMLNKVQIKNLADKSNLYLGIRSNRIRPLDHFHQINEGLKVGTTLKVINKNRLINTNSKRVIKNTKAFKEQIQQSA